MKFHFGDEDDGDVHAPAAHNGRLNGISAAPGADKPRRSRFRAPSTDSSTDSSDNEDDDDARGLSSSLSSMGISLLSNKSRQGAFAGIL